MQVSGVGTSLNSGSGPPKALPLRRQPWLLTRPTEFECRDKLGPREL